MKMNRRQFIKTCSAVSMGFWGLSQVACSSPSQLNRQNIEAMQASGYGPLITDPDGLLDLPKGFSYKIISRVGETMDDGFLLPGLPDGMATFEGPNGLTILIRNHELMPNFQSPFGKSLELYSSINREKLFDAGGDKTPCGGGTTTVIYDTKQQKVVKQYLSLVGTIRNCAGGPTPWNSWISCEETVLRSSSNESIILEKDHGYNFEVPASADIHLTDAVPLIDMGRFNHEAVAVNPQSGFVYQTEDRKDGLLYRFIPNTPGKLAKGGKLQALKLLDGVKDTRNWSKSKFHIPIGKQYAVEWVDMDNVESPKDDLRHRGYNAGAARFARGEGMWLGADGIYFACTSGGKEEDGQIWRYIPSPQEGTKDERKDPGKIELFVEPNNSNLVKNADNLTAAPWGDLIVCEDRDGDVIRLIGVTPQGKLYTFANSHQNTEFAGVCFSPDGSTLFVNAQDAGRTFAITGPWQQPIAG